MDPKLNNFYKDATKVANNIIRRQIKTGEFINYYNEPLIKRAVKYLFLPNLEIFLVFILVKNRTQKLTIWNFFSKLAIDTLYENCLHIECIPLVVYIPHNKLWATYTKSDDYEKSFIKICL